MVGAASVTIPQLISLALVLTLALGSWMRWAFAGAWPMGLDFNHLRHAHSHLGAYGVLFPLAFLAWKRLGAPSPSRRTLAIYSLATVIAVMGFLRAGYGVEAIAGSTVIGVIWLISAFRLRGRMRAFDDPLALVPPAIVAAMLCVPLIARNVRTDPEYAQRVVATFLGVLLLGAVMPSALAAIGARTRWTPLLTIASLFGAGALGLFPTDWSRLGLTVLGGWLVSVGLQRSLSWTLRVAWSVVGLGLIALSFKLVPNERPSIIGAIHLLVLGPVLLSLSREVWAPRAPLLEALLLGFVALLSGPLVLQAFGVMERTMLASAVGGTGVLVLWAASAFWPKRRTGTHLRA